ncbi:MAG: aldose 1-epimerase [Propylenella sp.]
MARTIAIETSAAIVEVLPEVGGGIAAFDLKRGTERIELFRRWDGKTMSARALGSGPMAPWFNRISGGGITLDGVFHPIAPNDPLDKFPLHGDAWSAPWEVTETAPSRIELRFRSRAIPPFDYEARQVLTLSGATLDTVLSLKHLGKKPLPYGMGHHPWFPRTPDVTLQAHATGVWLEQPPDFPTKTEAEPIPSKWDFGKPSRLPDDFIDNGFAGWDGRARIDWPGRGVALAIEADPAIHLYHVYSLGREHEVFCFEPVTHENNAFAKPGGAAANDLRVLQPGEETSMTVRFTGELR